jgi:large subunit ribosomal protein L19e
MAQNLRSQKKIASRALKVGTSRVWIDPTRLAEVSDAITAADIRRLYEDNVIKKLPKKGNSTARKKLAIKQKKKGRGKGAGSKKGKQGTRLARKTRWIKTVRSLRSFLKDLKSKMDVRVYRDVYKKAGSGFFRSRSHMITHLKRNKIVDDKDVEKKA